MSVTTTSRMRYRLRRRQAPPPPLSLAPEEDESDDSDDSDDSEDGIESDSDDSDDESSMELPSPTSTVPPEAASLISTTLRQSTLSRSCSTNTSGTCQAGTVLITLPDSTITAIVTGTESTALFVRPVEEITATPTPSRGELGAERTASTNSQSRPSQTAAPDTEPTGNMGASQAFSPALIGSLVATGLIGVVTVSLILLKRRNRVRISPPSQDFPDSTPPPVTQVDTGIPPGRDAENPFRDPPTAPARTYFM
ncbi:hypothetical protein CISG_00974 [Coccidioides immitis RMSCC 3703]|uniref:Uncharacterized protein n=1 Tax=Coccidioides immitis RMSCC 3703 TaxID=454286 RepID=A0A0J8QTM7_COCIT|nr:hypothetical protein CISG_00974 [Coccidioides immitis RMSCC 3703]